MAQTDQTPSAQPQLPAPKGAMAKLADFTFHRRKLTLFIWVSALVITIILAGSFSGKFRADYSTPGSGSKAAAEFIEQKYPGNTGDTVDVVWTSAAGATAAETEKQVSAFLTKLDAENGVGTVPGGVKSAQVSADKSIAVDQRSVVAALLGLRVGRVRGDQGFGCRSQR